MIRSLFDFKFNNLITRSVLGVLYAVLVGALSLAAVAGVLYSLYGLVSGRGTLPLLFLVLFPAGWFLSVITLRVAFETSIALILIAENTKK